MPWTYSSGMKQEIVYIFYRTKAENGAGSLLRGDQHGLSFLFLEVLEFITKQTHPQDNLFHSCYALLLAEEHQQGDQRDKCQQRRQVDQPIEATELGKYATQAVTKQLAQPQENGVETHQQSAVSGGIL